MEGSEKGGKMKKEWKVESNEEKKEVKCRGEHLKGDLHW